MSFEKLFPSGLKPDPDLTLPHSVAFVFISVFRILISMVLYLYFYLDLHGGHIEAPLRHSPLRASFFHFLEYFHSQRLDFESDSFQIL